MDRFRRKRPCYLLGVAKEALRKVVKHSVSSGDQCRQDANRVSPVSVLPTPTLAAYARVPLGGGLRRPQ